MSSASGVIRPSSASISINTDSNIDIIPNSFLNIEKLEYLINIFTSSLKLYGFDLHIEYDDIQETFNIRISSDNGESVIIVDNNNIVMPNTFPKNDGKTIEMLGLNISCFLIHGNNLDQFMIELTDILHKSTIKNCRY